MVQAPIGPNQMDVTVTVLTGVFQIRGVVRVTGSFQTFFNDETRPTISIYNANALAVAISNPAASMFQAEMIVNKRVCHAVIIEGVPPPGAFSFPPNRVQLVAYTEQFAIFGKFPIDAGAQVANFAELSAVPFVPVTEARLFPLFPARQGLASAASVALIHKSTLVTYHRA